jgi:hypothetical protein
MSISRSGNSWRARYYGPDGRQRSKSFQRKSDAERIRSNPAHGLGLPRTRRRDCRRDY